jgi:hypothetical protein
MPEHTLGTLYHHISFNLVKNARSIPGNTEIEIALRLAEYKLLVFNAQIHCFKVWR